MQALRQEILPPSGVEFAACLRLLPSTRSDSKVPGPSTITGRALFNVVVARSNHLRIFEVREEPPPISSQKEDEKERRASVRKGTEAVEGEVEMDASGEGFVNMGSIKVNWRSCHCFSRMTSNEISLFVPVCTSESKVLTLRGRQTGSQTRRRSLASTSSGNTVCMASLLASRQCELYHRSRTISTGWLCLSRMRRYAARWSAIEVIHSALHR